jgi:hypothetical protein
VIPFPVNQGGTASGTVPGLDVIKDVANHPRLGQVEAALSRRVEQHPRLRLATRAGHRQMRNSALDVMGQNWIEFNSIPHSPSISRSHACIFSRSSSVKYPRANPDDW